MRFDEELIDNLDDGQVDGIYGLIVRRPLAAEHRFRGESAVDWEVTPDYYVTTTIVNLRVGRA